MRSVVSKIVAVIVLLALATGVRADPFSFPPGGALTTIQVGGTAQSPMPGTINFGTGLSGSLSAGVLAITTTGGAPVTSVTASAPIASSGGTTPNITWVGTGTYSLGGTPSLAAALALGGQNLTGSGTFTGAITASGTASFDLSGGSGIFKTTTGAVTIGSGAISITGAVTSNIGGTTTVPWTTTGVASQNGFAYTGTQPASASGNGTSAGSILNFSGAAGGNTSGGTGQTAGTGEGISITLGAGGTAPGGSTNGTGGSFLVIPGTAGGGAGSAGSKGTVTAKAPAATYGTVFQVQNSAGAGNFTVTDAGNLATATGATYTAGSTVLIGSVADRLNAANLAIASQAAGDLLYANTTSTFARVAAGTTTQVLHGAAGAPTWASVTGADFANQSANVVFSGPSSGGAAAPTFRALVTADLPAAQRSSEFNFSAYNQGNLAAATTISRVGVANASTLQSSDAIINVAGVGGVGGFVVKLCSDGTTCGAGNIYVTCTIDCAGTAGTVVSCTVNKSAVSAATTLTYSVTTACATTDPGVNFNSHFTNP